MLDTDALQVNRIGEADVTAALVLPRGFEPLFQP